MSFWLVPAKLVLVSYIEQTNLGKKIHFLLLDYILDGGISGVAVARKIRV